MHSESIISVKRIGIVPTMDIEVKNKKHRFYVNGIVTSNSHAVSYAKITFQAGYLKAYYPTEYMCELLNGEISSSPNDAKIEMYVDESKYMGINVNPPSVFDGSLNFKIIEDGSINFGMGFIKHVGEQAASEALKLKGNFKTLTEFLLKCNMRVLNSGAVRAMIVGGAFDKMGFTRNVLLAKYDVVKDMAQKYKDQQKRKKGGVKLRVEFTPELIIEKELSINESYHPMGIEELLNEEREVLGAFISQSPTAPFEHIIRDRTNADVYGIMEGDISGDKLCMAGRINAIKIHVVKKGDNAGKEMAFINIAYHNCDIEAMVFTAAYAKLKKILKEGKIYLFMGRSERMGFFSVEDAETLSQT